MWKYIYIFFIIPFLTKAQHKNTSYFDKNGRLTYVESAFYYRENTDTSNFFRSYYTSSKNKFFEGKIVNARDTIDTGNIYAGLCIWYYSNGKMKIKSEYSNSGILNGISEVYSEDGFLEKRINYINGKINFKQHLEFDKKGNEIQVFEEDFDNNDLDWKVTATDKMQSKIKIGGLSLANLSKYDYAVFSETKIDSSNYKIITSINSNYVTTDCKTGIIFGFKDWKNYNYFYVSKFRYHIGFVENGVTYKKIDNFFSDELKGDNVNELNITAINDSIYYYINHVLQNYCHYNGNIKEAKIGFYITNGKALFDNLIIKQYNDKTLTANIDRHQLFYTFNGQKIPVKQIYSGIVIGKNGYIATALMNVPQINKVLIEQIVNDSIKQYQANILIHNNFTILKLQDSTIKLPDVLYNSYTYNQLIDNKFFTYVYEKNILQNKYHLNRIEGNAKSINSHKHDLFPQTKNSHYCEGAPIFDLKGGLLGVISSVDMNNNIKTIGTRDILYPIYTQPKTNELKPKENFSMEHFEQNVSKNIVIIKVF